MLAKILIHISCIKFEMLIMYTKRIFKQIINVYKI